MTMILVCGNESCIPERLDAILPRMKISVMSSRLGVLPAERAPSRPRARSALHNPFQSAACMKDRMSWLSSTIRILFGVSELGRLMVRLGPFLPRAPSRSVGTWPISSAASCERPYSVAGILMRVERRIHRGNNGCFVKRLVDMAHEPPPVVRWRSHRSSRVHDPHG